MEHIGIDVHKNESRICMQTEAGEILEPRVLTRRDRFAAVLGDRPRARILIEASTESEWVARCLEELGHEVIVADPNYAPMYATRSRRVKTDRRDAQALMDACRLGAYRPAHRTSEPQRRVRGLLAVRDHLVRSRVRQMGLLRALLRREGLRVRSGSAWSFAQRLGELELPEWLGAVAGPVVATMKPISQQRDEVERAIGRIVQGDPVVRRLCTAPNVGPVTAVAFVAAVDGVERFARAHQVECYLGLVARERSSGEQQHKGAITKAGSSRVRGLLVEAAWRIWLSRSSNAEELRRWAERIATRRGRRIAVVALARRLAGILYAMWRDGAEFEPRRRPRGGNTALPVAAA
jgi:transposase